MERNKRKATTKARVYTSAAPEAIAFAPPSFEVDDEAGYKYLEEHGYVVFKNVLTPTEVEKGRSLAWDFLENMKGSSINRNDPNTWDKGWPDPFGKGIIVSEAVGQSEFLWHVRGVEKVQKIYKTVWATNEVITSYDGFCMHRPFEYNSNWLTKTGWYHLDQNVHTKPNKICVQGLVNFYDAGDSDGGLVVVPDSIHIFNDIFKNRPGIAKIGDFVRLDKNNNTGIWKNEVQHKGLKPIKICAKAGDMLLWDSRTIHCNSPATTPRPLPTDGTILSPRRLVAYVCMTPTNRISPQLKAKRLEAYKIGHTTSHWPEDCNISGRRNTVGGYTPVSLNDSQKQLIPMD